MKSDRRAMLAFAILLVASASPAQQALFDDETQAFLKNHCVRCHGESEQEGEFRIDNLGTDFADPRHGAKVERSGLSHQRG